MSGNLRRSSTVFDVVLAMRDQVEQASFPTDVAGLVPEVSSANPFVEEFREVIAVVPNVDDTFAQWARMGPAGRDETYRVDIVTRIVTPGLSDRECWERLGAITGALEGIWHDPTSRQFTPPDVPGVVLRGGVVGVIAEVQPAAEGFAGQSTIRFEISARI